MVAPKRLALAEANRKLEGANRKLAGIRAKVKELQDRVAALEVGLMKATEDKNNAIAQVGREDRGVSTGWGLSWGLSQGLMQGVLARPALPQKCCGLHTASCLCCWLPVSLLNCSHPIPPKAERTSRKAGLADRLVNGLSGENKRWSETIRRLEGQEGMLVGDVLLAAAFVCASRPLLMDTGTGR